MNIRPIGSRPQSFIPFTDTKLKASYGTGFKAPTLSELFQNFPDFNFFANPNLKPEQSRGADIGFEQPLFNDRIRFGSTYFQNDITRPDLHELPMPRFYHATSMSDNAITEGTENFVLFNIIDRFKVRADYTFTRAVDTDTGFATPTPAKGKVQALPRLWNPIDPLTLSATVLHVSDWPRYRLGIHLRRTCSLRLATPSSISSADYAINDQIKVFGRIDNVANVHYQNPNGFLAPGLGVFGGIRFASYGVK